MWHLDDNTRYAYILESGHEARLCSPLTGKVNDTLKVKYYEVLDDTTKGQRAIGMEFTGSEDITHFGNKPYKFNIEIICNSSSSDRSQVANYNWVKSYNGEEFIEVHTISGCP